MFSLARFDPTLTCFKLRGRKSICMHLVLIAIFLCFSGGNRGDAKSRPGLGILPFSVTYPTSEVWLGWFLQEEMSWQIAKSNTHAIRSPQEMKLWSSYFHLTPADSLSNTQIQAMKLHVVLQGTLQKVLYKALLRGEFIITTPKKEPNRLPLERELDARSPKSLLRDLVHFIKDVYPPLELKLDDSPFSDWNAVEQFYQWKTHTDIHPSHPQWSEYKNDLAAIGRRFPELGWRVEYEKAVMAIAEATMKTPYSSTLLQTAQEHLNVVTKVFPENDLVHSALALTYLLRGQTQSAKTEAMVANASNPQNGMVWMILGLSISKSPLERKQYFERGQKWNPFIDPDFFVDRPYQFLEYKTPLWSLVKGKAPEQSQSFTGIYQEGLKFYQEQNWSAALEKWQLALQAQPDNVAVRLYLAQTYLQLNQAKDAIQLLRPIEQNPQSTPKISFLLGFAYEKNQQFKEAERLFKLVLKLQPEDPATLMHLGVVQTQLGNYAEARTHLEISTQIKPQDVQGWWNLGMVYWHMGQWSMAASAWNTCLEQDPEQQLCQQWLAEAQQKL